MSRQQISDVKGLFKSVPQVRILSRLWSDKWLRGAYRSAFRGMGLAFKDIREYEPGDDYRHVDWNAMARTGEPYTKCFEEERELSIILAFDCSASLDFGTRNRTKKELAALFGATVAFNAVQQGDRIGGFFFGPGGERFFPASKGLGHAMALIDSFLKETMKPGRSDPARVLDRLNRAFRRRSVIFLVSDFLDKIPETNSLAPVGRHHNLIPVVVRDPIEAELPSSGFMAVGDPDGSRGRELAPVLIDTSDPNLRKRYKNRMAGLDRELMENFRRASLETIWLRTDRPILESLRNFMVRYGRGTRYRTIQSPPRGFE